MNKRHQGRSPGPAHAEPVPLLPRGYPSIGAILPGGGEREESSGWGEKGGGGGVEGEGGGGVDGVGGEGWQWVVTRSRYKLLTMRLCLRSAMVLVCSLSCPRNLLASSCRRTGIMAWGQVKLSFCGRLADGRTDRQTDKWVYGYTQTDTRLRGRTDARRPTGRQTDGIRGHPDEYTDTRADKRTERPTGRQTDRETDTWIRRRICSCADGRTPAVQKQLHLEKETWC